MFSVHVDYGHQAPSHHLKDNLHTGNKYGSSTVAPVRAVQWAFYCRVEHARHKQVSKIHYVEEWTESLAR